MLGRHQKPRLSRDPNRSTGEICEYRTISGADWLRPPPGARKPGTLAATSPQEPSTTIDLILIKWRAELSNQLSHRRRSGRYRNRQGDTLTSGSGPAATDVPRLGSLSPAPAGSRSGSTEPTPTCLPTCLWPPRRAGPAILVRGGSFEAPDPGMDEQFHARLWPNNAMPLSRKEWL